MLLSICIPTYNREKELVKLFQTIPNNQEIEIVVCDDGSTDNTKAVIEQYQKDYTIKYFYQSNAGRASALKVAIEHATAQWVVLMDSDDYFMQGWYALLLEAIHTLEQYSQKDNINSLVFGVKLIKNGKIDVNLPLVGISNLVKFRVETDNVKDCKELVKTDILKSCLYQVETNIRRVPTSLLWLRVAEKTNCLCIAKPLAIKEYLSGGMSDTILKLKIENALPMVELNVLMVQTNCYRSTKYRFKSMLLWGRYYHHCAKKDTSIQYLWQYVAYLLGYLIFLLDRIKLEFFHK